MGASITGDDRQRSTRPKQSLVKKHDFLNKFDGDESPRFRLGPQSNIERVLSPEEVARFLEAALGPKYKAALGAAYGAGLRVSEVASRQLRIMLSPFQHRASICNTFYRDE